MRDCAARDPDGRFSLFPIKSSSMTIHPVLLCGGSGTRLWPLSRKSYPKQFSSLLGDLSLFQASAQRLTGSGFAKPLIVTGSDFRFIVTEQLDRIALEPAAILIEPAARNTAPATLAAALVIAAQTPDALMLVAPSDHVIPDAPGFREAVLAASETARDGQFVTFGIRPDRAETGYGWLEPGTAQVADLAPCPQPLARFVEKPDLATAQRMLAGGRHLWNAGIFLLRVDVLIAAFATHQPQLLKQVREAVNGAQADMAFTRLDPAPWAAIDDVSIDYAVMEKADNLSVVLHDGVWSDLGGWEAVWREGGPDARGVVTSGAALAIDCHDSLLRSESEGLEVVGIGLRDIIAVAMPDAVLIAHKDRAQGVKQAVAALKARGAVQAETFPRDHRPWGWFESLVTGPRFQVKRIVVRPGAALSLQSHHHRAEHWIVVEGTAKVTIDDKVQLVAENQSVYIPLGAVHRMENPGKVPLTLIEVQTGAYLGEDDIIRHEDVYARGQGAKG
jgi:mannose-1-phosphate guanylyltransferase / mannose-6-phosphate isomerase